MAGFCGNCGAPLDDDARVCGQCGTPIEGYNAKVAGLTSMDPEKKKKLIKRIRAIVIAAVIAVIAVIGTKTVLSFVGANGLVRKVMSAYKKYDIEGMVALSSDMYYYNSSEDFVEQYFESVVGNSIDEIESAVGHKYRISYRIDDFYELSQRRMDETLKEISYYHPDFDVDTIDKIKVAKVEMMAKQNKKSITRYLTITMGRENNTWRVIYLES